MDIVLRATAMFVLLYALIRLLGKRELGQMTPFELVLLVVKGDLIQQGVTHNDFSLTGGMLAIGTFAFWALVLSWLTYLFPALKNALKGEPRVIVKHGAIIEANLRRDRLTRDKILSEMRLAGIARLADVRWAILEPQGKISFISRDSRRHGWPRHTATFSSRRRFNLGRARGNIAMSKAKPAVLKCFSQFCTRTPT